MQATLRKIGNSQGLIIPASFIDQLGLSSQVEMTLENDALVIKALRVPRQGWFDQLIDETDEDVLKNYVDSDCDREDWQW